MKYTAEAKAMLAWIAVGMLSVTACGSGDGAAQSAQPLSEAKLSQAVLIDGDVSGYTVREVEGSEKGESAQTDKKSCMPIVEAMAPETVAYQDRSVRRGISKTPTGSERSEASYQLVLFSESSGSAADKAVDDLKKAVSACTDGFAATLSGEVNEIRRVTLNNSDFGDKSVDFSLEYRMGMKMRYVMAASGASLIDFSASNQFAHTFVEVPSELFEAQKGKLESAEK